MRLTHEERARAEGAMAALEIAGKRITELEAENNRLNGMLHMAVDRLGGEVEGAPTQPLNFLQRIDVLVAMENDVFEADDYLPEPSVLFPTLGERTKLLKDQMEYATESCCQLSQEVTLLRNALSAAALSLETIHKQAWRDEYLKHMEQVRGYANSRASVARAALQGIPEDKPCENAAEQSVKGEDAKGNTPEDRVTILHDGSSDFPWVVYVDGRRINGFALREGPRKGDGADAFRLSLIHRIKEAKR